jgi:hypothetical protein
MDMCQVNGATIVQMAIKLRTVSVVHPTLSVCVGKDGSVPVDVVLPGNNRLLPSVASNTKPIEVVVEMHRSILESFRMIQKANEKFSAENCISDSLILLAQLVWCLQDNQKVLWVNLNDNQSESIDIFA